MVSGLVWEIHKLTDNKWGSQNLFILIKNIVV
jgi:hypothetical protein